MSSLLPKVVLLGDAGVGKTCIAELIRQNQFDENCAPTVGADDIVVDLTYDNVHSQFKLWDTAGQEKFQALAPMYIRGCHISILVYDITNQESFKNLNLWFSIVSQTQQKDMPKIIIIGNKCDLENKEITPSQRVDKANELEKLSEVPIQIKSLDMSAKTHEGEEILLPMLLEFLKIVNEPSQAVTLNQDHSNKCC